MPASASAKGTIVQGEYVLLEPIGDADGRVYRAHHMATGRLAAVRIWRGEAGSAAERILETAQIASRVRHPALAAVEAYGQLGDGTFFVVSEFVAGEPLDQWADKVGIPPLATVIDLVHRLCVGLNAAHRNGLTHDALHPGNIRVRPHEAAPLLRLDGRLLDLGVPACMHTWPPRVYAAQFMAPEQLARALHGNDAARVRADGRMNVYSCGCLLYWLSTGGAPFPDRNLHDLVRSHAGGKLVPASKINPQIPPALDAIIERALAQAPSERYPSVSDLALALARVQVSRTASSGVRPVVLAPSESVVAQAPDKRTTVDRDFEERPTSESRLPELPPAQERKSSVPPPVRHAPVGSFSSQRPPAEIATLPPPRASAPPPPIASATTARVPPLPPLPPPSRAPLPVLSPITALLEQPPPPEREWTAGGAPARAARLIARARRARYGLRLGARMTAALVLGFVVAAVAVWLARASLPAEHVRTTPLPVDETTSARPSSARASKLAPGRAPSRSAPIDATQGLVAAPPHGPNAPQSRAQPDHAFARSRPARALRARGAISARGDAPGGAASARSGPAQIEAAPVISVRTEPTDEAAADAEHDEPEDNDREPEPDPVAQPVAASPAQRAVTTVAASEVSARTSDPQTISIRTRERAQPSAAPRPSGPLRTAPGIRALTVRGSLTTAEVRRAVERIRPQLHACYSRAAQAAGRSVFGELSMEIEIDERGRAHAPRAAGGMLPGLDACAAAAAGKIVAGRPPDTGTVKATWKVVFSP